MKSVDEMVKENDQLKKSNEESQKTMNMLRQENEQQKLALDAARIAITGQDEDPDIGQDVGQQVVMPENQSEPISLSKEQFEREVDERASRKFLEIQSKIEEARQTQDKIYKEFYQQNPDLKGKELIVGTIAKNITSKMPKIKVDEKLYKTIASETREYLSKLGIKSAPAPISEGQGASPGIEKPGPEDTGQTDVDYVAERKRLYSKGQQSPL